MQIELTTPDGMMYRIDSDNPKTIGHWFAEWAERFAATGLQSMMPVRMYVWSSDRIRVGEQPSVYITAEKLQWLADKFKEWNMEGTDVGGL